MSSDLPRIGQHLTDLGVVLDLWATRDDTQAGPGVRQSANAAVDAIDGMLRGLHAARRELIGEIRAYDDATAARTDALIRRLRDTRTTS